MDLSWGLPRLIVRKKKGGASNPYIEFYKPVEGTTQLTTSKGEKKEAKIEGGENEAVKYAKNTYSLASTIRQALEDGKIREKPIEDVDGVIEGEYELWLQPENPAVPGIHIRRCTISVEDSWSAADGGTWTYTFDAVKEEGYNQIEWEVFSIDGEYLAPINVGMPIQTGPNSTPSSSE